MNLCPSCRYLIAANTGNRAADTNGKDNFYPEKYDLIDDDKIVHLKAIRVHTSHLAAIRIFVCQNKKGQPQNYCDDLSAPEAEKRICESNKTDYVFFYVDRSEHERSKNKPIDPVYMVAFAKYSKENEEICQEIVAEVKRTAKWLGIAGSVIQCYIFYYTTSSLCNTFDWGTFRKKYDEQCRDSKYFFQFQYIAPNKKPLWLNVTGGSPVFTIKIQEM